ncbi:hypothetical protein NDU88_004460 [Pleurodeles waltl]|uniref:Uncharacterized protein n=1 Tax=Pleurodeles waltl TaxID=8319 RepID=A0AAV7RIB5_PLEWA|nr:hypothetical protein NDU88_004460 [Pleurodeles waltl]
MVDPVQGATMDRILQAIVAVGRKLERMDNATASLTTETKSMRLEIAGFQSRIPQWVVVEKALLSHDRGLGGVYRDDLSSSRTANLILKVTRAAWRRAHCLFGVHPLLHAQATLWNNNGLRIGREVLNWQQWSRAGILNLAQVLEDGAPKSFAKLQEEFNLHPQQEW